MSFWEWFSRPFAEVAAGLVVFVGVVGFVFLAVAVEVVFYRVRMLLKRFRNRRGS